MKPKAPYGPTFHRDGTVSFWSVYQQCHVWRCKPWRISDREFAAMDERSRKRIIRLIDRLVEKSR